MSGLIVKEKDVIINICPNGSAGDIIDLSNLQIQLPKKPKKEDILFHDLPKKDQYWRREDPPRELGNIRSMDEWHETPREFREKYSGYIEREFERRKKARTPSQELKELVVQSAIGRDEGEDQQGGQGDAQF